MLYNLPEKPVEHCVKQVIRKFPYALWIEGCEGPTMRTFEIDVELKEGSRPRAMQPFNISAYDQLRVDYMIEEEVALGKRVHFDPNIHRLPEWASSLFIVDQKGKGVLGRMVAAYMEVNNATVQVAAAAPDVDRAFRLSSGCRFHTTADLVWGYSQFDLSPASQRLFACISRSGITFPTKAPFGGKTLPAICQTKNTHEFGGLIDHDGVSKEPFVVVAIDDFKISSVKYDQH